ncbi:MAG: 3' terminal RNA ribose 2'-O-methyltransferase Hen1 [Proteobacteria bacterium]|nr:3' terminal RNA ribose 2'-O-methyltransferase Hen1 [Pseudomonadota bacterium]
MLITITNKTEPATNLGYLLHKNPAKVHRVELSFGDAYIFYSAATEQSCTVCLLVDVDPLSMVQGRGDLGYIEAPYVNDRPYVASSLLTTALHKAFGTALSGRCKERPELVEQALDLTITLPVMITRGGYQMLTRLFGPLGYILDVKSAKSDEGQSHSHHASPQSVTMHTIAPIREVLSHLSLLIPVADHQNHRWLEAFDAEVMLRRAQNWLPQHPEARLIIRRALKHQRHLYKSVMAKYPDIGTGPDSYGGIWDDEDFDQAADHPESLNQQRFDAIGQATLEIGGKTVVDLGCGNGKLIAQLTANPNITKLVGMDASVECVSRAKDRLSKAKISPHQLSKVSFKQGSLFYDDPELSCFDTALLIEVIEHLEVDRLPTLERLLFGRANHSAIIVTTPNREYNALYAGLGEGDLRHSDHRFEWSRGEFHKWVSSMSATYDYSAEIRDIGLVDPSRGAPTQMAIFRKNRSETTK